MKLSTLALHMLTSLAALPFTATAQAGGNQTGAYLRDHVSRNGISWHFADLETVGRYANGDWWVVGPVTLTAITPQSTTNPTTGRRINGTHINPDPNEAVQGLDSQVYYKLAHSYPGWYYDHSLNIGATIVANGSLTVPVNSSVISCESRTVLNTTDYSQIQRVEVLTVVSSQPSPNSFRPCYAGSRPKVSTHTADEVDFSKLPNLPVPPGVEVPTWEVVAALVGGVWYEAPGKEDAQIMRCSRPIDVMPDYGQKVQSQYYEALTYVMMSNGTASAKRKAVLNMVQIGLDRYVIADLDRATYDSNGKESHPGHFSGDAGQGCGAKFSIYFAGWLLGDQAMMDFSLPSATPESYVTMGWQEDDQVFIVEATEPGFWNYGVCGYGPGGGTFVPEGTPEWGIKHYQEVRKSGFPSSDDSHWTSSDPDPEPNCGPKCGSSPNGTCNVSYRTCCTSNVWWMGNLFSRVIAQERGIPSPDLYRPEFYHYAERYYSNMTGQWAWVVANSPTTLFYRGLFEKTWLAYNGSYPIPPLQ